jgi:D-inositol-3-phosphate glycosyltransferase
MSRRRIAFLSEHASPIARLGGQDAGGQNVYVDEVSRNLGQLGYQVDVFTRRDSVDLPEVVDWAHGVRVVHLNAGPPETLLKDQLWPLMPEFRDSLLRFMRRNGIDYDLLHGNFWMSGWVAAEIGETLGIPVVQIFHAMGLTKRRHQGDADTSPDERIEVEQDVLRRADRFIAQCPTERSELVDDYGVESGRVVVIPSAVNIHVFHPVDRSEARRRIGLANDELVVGYIGRMVPRKGVRNLLRAAALLINRFQIPVRLLLVGGETHEPDRAATPEIGVLQDLAAELGISDEVSFTGKRQPDDLHLYYGSADVVVTTPWYEPFGLTPLEAMACGRPVVGSAVGGLTFTIGDGVTGFLVPPKDPEALAERLRQLLTNEPLRRKMGERARQRVVDRFTWPVVAGRTAHLYEELLSDNGRSSNTLAGLEAGEAMEHVLRN